MKFNAKFDQRLFGPLRDELERRLSLAAERGEESSGQPLILWVVASWIHDGCTRPITWDEPHHWGESPEHRRRRDGHGWLLFSSKACAEATLLSVRTTQHAVRELIRLGLVESYRETRRPRPIRYRGLDEPYELDWYGPRTQVVRVVLEPPPSPRGTPSMVGA
jgi:hypothetical protein